MTKENAHLMRKGLLQYYKFDNLGIHENIGIM